MQSVVEAAPRLIDFFGAESLAHFEAVKAVLDAARRAIRSQHPSGSRHGLLQPDRVRVVTERLGARKAVCRRRTLRRPDWSNWGKPVSGWLGFGHERLLLLLKNWALSHLQRPQTPCRCDGGYASASGIDHGRSFAGQGRPCGGQPAGKDGPASPSPNSKGRCERCPICARVWPRRTGWRAGFIGCEGATVADKPRVPLPMLSLGLTA